jgi:hypothetical protein
MAVTFFNNMESASQRRPPWEQRHKVQRRKRKTTPTQLLVSDMHSSCYAFEYVSLPLMLLPLIFYSTTQSSTGSEQKGESDNQC